MVASISAISRSFLRICAAVASRSFAKRSRSGSAPVLLRRLPGWLGRTWLAAGAAVEATVVRERKGGREGRRAGVEETDLPGDSAVGAGCGLGGRRCASQSQQRRSRGQAALPQSHISFVRGNEKERRSACLTCQVARFVACGVYWLGIGTAGEQSRNDGVASRLARGVHGGAIA